MAGISLPVSDVQVNICWSLFREIWFCACFLKCSGNYQRQGANQIKSDQTKSKSLIYFHSCIMNQILRVLKWFNVCDSSRLVSRRVPFFGHPGIIPFWGYLLLKTRIQQHFLRSQFLFIINMNVAFSWKWGTFDWFPSTIVQFWFLWKNVLKQEIKVFSAAWWPAGSALLSKCKYLSEFCLLSFNSLTMQASRSYVADSCTFTPQALPPFFNLQQNIMKHFILYRT